MFMKPNLSSINRQPVPRGRVEEGCAVLPSKKQAKSWVGSAVLESSSVGHSLKLFFLFLSSVFFQSVNAQTTITVPANADAQLFLQGASNNYGGCSYLGINRGPTVYVGRGLIRFDLSLIPANAKIVSATLQLEKFGGTSTGLVDVLQVSNAWDEGTNCGAAGTGATWQRRNANIFWNSPGGDVTSPSVLSSTTVNADGTYSWSVTSAVDAWINDKHPNYGFLLRYRTENHTSNEDVLFADRTNANTNIRPKLIVTYYDKCDGTAPGVVNSDGDAYVDACDVDDDNDGILDTDEGQARSFQWSGVPVVSGTNTATGTINGINYTYTSSSPVVVGTYSMAVPFPASYNVPNVTTAIQNTQVTTNTLTFASPIKNPILLFTSIGRNDLGLSGGTNIAVPVTFAQPITVLYSNNVTINSSTQITGYEGNAILQLSGIYSSITFTYSTAENWCNFMFGANFVDDLDTDGDGVPDYLDTDSDNDGCADAIEGSGSLKFNDINQMGRLNSSVQANGVPLSAGSGQAIGSSRNAGIIVCCDASDSGYPDADGDDVTDRCDQDTDNDGILNSAESNYAPIVSSFETPNIQGYTGPNSFGNGGDAETDWVTYPTSSVLDGWTIVAGNIDLQRDIINAAAGSQSIDLYGTSNGAIERVFSVPAAGTPFSFSVDFTSLNSAAQATLSVDGTIVSTLNNSTTAIANIDIVGVRGYSQNWQTYTFSGVSTGTSVNLRLTNTSAGLTGTGIMIDKIKFEAFIDTDKDGVPDYLDLDSDNDGCADVIEGGASFVQGANYITGNRLNTTVDPATGVPALPVAVPAITGYTQVAGQTVGFSQVATTATNTQPAIKYVSVGASNTLTVTATSSNTTSFQTTAPFSPLYGTANNNGSLTYKWYLGDPASGGTLINNGGSYAGATSASLIINPVTPAMLGTKYYCVVGASNNACLAVSSNTELRGITITQQPQLQYGCIGYSNTFSVAATPAVPGNPLTYQWKKQGVDIPGATNSSYRITSVNASDSGSWTRAYTVVVSEPALGISITSEPAWLVLNKQAEYTGPATGGSADWLTPSNWSTNAVPDSSIHAYIPATVTNMNLTSGTLKCKCLTIETGAKVTVNGGTLEIAGRINNSATEASPTTFGGTLNVVNGSVVMNGTSVVQKLWDGVFETSFIKDLTIGNEVGVNLEGDLSLTGVYTPIFSSSTRVLNIATNKRLILKSTATNTARVITGPSTGGYINGAVTVERYLYPHPGRRWTAMAAPVSQLISESWQEDIYVTGPGTGGFMCAPPYSTNTQPTQHTNGMDATQLNPVSMQTFNTPGGWTAITNTLTTSLTPGKGYFVNVRGDRNIHGCALLQFTNPQTPTTQTFEATVKATGTLTQGNFSIPTTSTGFYLVGNPYASEISFSSLYGGNSGNMQNKYWLTNPATQDGNYMTWDGTNHAGAASGYSNFDRIASGQSFFVNMTTPNSTILFTESMKVNARQQGGFKTTVFGGKLRVNIYRSGDSLKQDDALIVFDQPTSSTNNTVSAIDSRSINTGSVVVATWKGTTRLAINKRADNFTTDTVGVYVNAGIVGGYSFHFTELNTLTGATVYLLDNQTNTLHNVSQTPTYSFNVATAGVINNRFQIIFQTNPLSADELEFRAQNVDGYGHLSWSVQSAKGRVRYDVQSSEDGISFTEIGSKEAKEEVSGASYRFVDTRLIEGRRFYRIEANHEDGSRSFSHTKMVSNVGNSSFSFSIAPNPVSDKLNVVFMGNEASHTIRIYDVAGKLMHEQVTGGKDCVVNTSAYAAGSYLIEVTSVNGTKQTKKFIK